MIHQVGFGDHDKELTPTPHTGQNDFWRINKSKNNFPCFAAKKNLKKGVTAFMTSQIYSASWSNRLAMVASLRNVPTCEAKYLYYISTSLRRRPRIILPWFFISIASLPLYLSFLSCLSKCKLQRSLQTVSKSFFLRLFLLVCVSQWAEKHFARNITYLKHKDQRVCFDIRAWQTKITAKDF